MRRDDTEMGPVRQTDPRAAGRAPLESAGMGHGVDVSTADPGTLPARVQGDVAGATAEAEGGCAEVLADEGRSGRCS